jgi:3-hydroxy acid dehydrogenase / malonic semialdehyde reductase
MTEPFPHDPLHGRLVLVTGATAGIGLSCAVAFARRGANLILTGRRFERLEELKEELEEGHEVQVTIERLDVRDRAGVEEFVDRLVAEDLVPDVLVNNAGLSRGLDPLHEGHVEDWEEMIDTNVKGLLYMTRALLPHMVQRNSGHVINLGSTAGHLVYPRGNVYNATKFAVRALTEGMNLDVAGTRVRVSSVDPGLVETEFSRVRFHGDTARADQVYAGLTPLTPDDIADIVCYVASAPPHVNIVQTVVYPTDQRNAYVIHRESEGTSGSTSGSASGSEPEPGAAPGKAERETTT